MFEIVIETKSGKRVDHRICDQRRCSLGRSDDCLVSLHGWKVSGLHATVELRETGLYLKDANSRTGTHINRRRIPAGDPGYGPLAPADVVAIGDYRLVFKSANTAPTAQAQAQAAGANSAMTALADPLPQNVPTDAATPPAPSAVAEQAAGDSPVQQLYEEYRSKVHRKLLELIDLRRVNVDSMDDATLRTFTYDAIGDVLQSIDAIPPVISREALRNQVLAEAIGLGPLEKLLADKDISEIMVNSHREIFFEKRGALFKSSVTFTDDKAVVSAIERIVSPLGRRIDEASPMVDARLKDGSRLNAVIPPLALKGPALTIRKFMQERLDAQRIIDFGSVNQPMMDFLATCVRFKKNVVISGGTGSGKTTLLNVLSNFIPDAERIVTVEDAAELTLYQPNLVALEARPPNQEGKGSVTIRDLVKNCLRMRPDRIVVGECRGGEALDMLQAMNTGHDGSLTTVHSNSPRDCISRLEVLVLMSGMDLPVSAIREQIASSIDIIVQQTRFRCGSRKVTSISEVTGMEGNVVQLAEIFTFAQRGFDDAGKVQGRFKPTGMVPDFYEDMKNRKIDVDFSVFCDAGDTLP